MASNESTMIVTANIYPFPQTSLGPNVEQQQQRLTTACCLCVLRAQQWHILCPIKGKKAFLVSLKKHAAYHANVMLMCECETVCVEFLMCI